MFGTREGMPGGLEDDATSRQQLVRAWPIVSGLFSSHVVNAGSVTSYLYRTPIQGAIRTDEGPRQQLSACASSAPKHTPRDAVLSAVLMGSRLGCSRGHTCCAPPHFSRSPLASLVSPRSTTAQEVPPRHSHQGCFHMMRCRVAAWRSILGWRPGLRLPLSDGLACSTPSTACQRQRCCTACTARSRAACLPTMTSKALSPASTQRRIATG